MQGWRRSNEDAHINAMNFEPDLHLFAVFDGHGGCEVAKYCKKYYIDLLRAEPAFAAKDYESALRNSFLKIDRDLISEKGKKELVKIARENGNDVTDGTELSKQCGCTANVCLVTPTHIYVANTGDARCVVSENKKAIDLSVDHKPDLPSERSRVYAAGHTVEDSRVDGIIAISRALGDWEYKNERLDADKMAVSGHPEIRVHPIGPNTEFFICACDGIWDCMTSQVAVDFVHESIPKVVGFSKKNDKSPPARKSSVANKEKALNASIEASKFKGLATVVEMMMDFNCPTNLAQSDGLGTDNMTCIIV